MAKSTGGGSVWLALFSLFLVICLATCGDGLVLDPGDPCAGGVCEAGVTPDAGPDGQSGQFDFATPDASAPCKGTPCGATGCCTTDQICLTGKCVKLGPKCGELWPCPANYYCDKVKNRCIPGAKKCEYRPPPGVFSPKVEWEWTGSTVLSAYNQVMMTPMVANLTDDNADGKINRDDIPDVIFSTFTGSAYGKDGVLRVISGDGKKEHFTVTDATLRNVPGAELAIADIDNDLKPEIVVCASGGGIMALEHDGKLKWKTTGVPCRAPAIADLHGDGSPEVITGCNVLVGTSGKVAWKGAYACTTYSTVADIDLDGKPEVVGGNVAYNHDGSLLWRDKNTPDGFVAIADLNGDKIPEVITAASGKHALYAHSNKGKLIWGPVDINQGQANLADKCSGCGGGPPTIADFDGDGRPEIAAAGGYGYVIFEHDGKPKWFKKTQDLSSRCTGSSVFDFDGDGKAEVVYADELQLRIYQGPTGAVLFSHCNTSGTLTEYPLIVDVDNDGHAEIVVSNNNYAFKKCADSSASHTGIKVLGDTKGNWVRTRRIWNQHTYHVTNIDEDGRVPKVEDRNWANPNLNNFRQNVQPGGLFDAPDMIAGPDKLACSASLTASVKVKNDGAAKVVPGVKVTLYAATPTGTIPLQTKTTKTTIYAGQTETVQFSIPTPKSFLNQTIQLLARVDDDGKGVGAINECKEDNNKTQLGSVLCKTIN